MLDRFRGCKRADLGAMNQREIARKSEQGACGEKIARACRIDEPLDRRCGRGLDRASIDNETTLLGQRDE